MPPWRDQGIPLGRDLASASRDASIYLPDTGADTLGHTSLPGGTQLLTVIPDDVGGAEGSDAPMDVGLGGEFGGGDGVVAEGVGGV